jgi:tryptophan synthase beta chain
VNRRVDLNVKDIPKQWYNIRADMPTPVPPPLNPGTGQPITPDMLEAIFPKNVIEQEVIQKDGLTFPMK